MHPETLIETFGTLGIFAIVFAESGLLFGFFLPGDSLLFTAGLLSSRGFSNIFLLMGGCAVAAVAGDQVGYLIGRRAGPALFRRPDSRFFHQKNVQRARDYFEKHGPKTIILARFVPVVRTFAPVVAGVGEMDYRRFVTFNVVGGVVWGAGVTLLGYLLGNTIHDIDRWLLPIIGLIIAVSFVPVFHEVWKARQASRATADRG
ncbi:MAG TPA: VTT domain-containing protein [Acidimicrobiales bacterium]|nr:VTT domain-containing protein [Acidimicrobiales bacterium]